MNRHLFLAGPTGSGKTTLLRGALGDSLREAGGFVTEAVHGPYGDFIGLALLPAAAEIGGFELIIPQFRTTLYELLRSDLPIIGALKTPEEADAMRQALGLGDKFSRFEDELWQFLRHDKDTQILYVRSLSDEAAAEALAQWKREHLA